jgi:DNA-directed RNA polymerase specialized sigma24 family protein
MPDPLEILRPGLLRHAAQRCGPNDAPDLVQDALVAASRQMFRERDAALILEIGFAQWVYSILDNRCTWHLSLLSRRAETLTPPDRVLTLLEMPSDVDVTAAGAEAEREILYTLLDRVYLTGVQGQCIHLWLEDHSLRRIAAYLMISPSTVRDHITAVKIKLSEMRASTEGAYQSWWFWELSAVSVYHAPETQGGKLSREKLARQAARERPRRRSETQ